jgi:hypothetical protein
MAKSKLAPARLYPQGSPTKYHPVSIAISQAQAAAWLLERLHHGDLACHLGGRGDQNRARSVHAAAPGRTP